MLFNRGLPVTLPNHGLLIRLSHELGVALELSYSPDDLRAVWSDALEALPETRQLLLIEGLPVPEVVDNVISLSEFGTVVPFGPRS
jgi:hypothetical protein